MYLLFCLNPYACINYMVAYVTKHEREIGLVLKAISKEMASETIRTQMKKCAPAFENAREVSAQESVMRLLSIPLFKSNFETVFIPIDLPEKRIRLLKSYSRTWTTAKKMYSRPH